MYSYEDRIRAVKLYLHLGKCTSATIRQLGYGSTKSLQHWYDTYAKYLELLKDRGIPRAKYLIEHKKVATDPVADIDDPAYQG